jgi:hypothetical protein
MILRTMILALAVTGSASFAAPATKPASTAPSTAPAQVPLAKLTGSLANGTIRFAAPEGWQSVQSDNGLTVSYMAPDHAGIITVLYAPQEIRPTEDFKQSMGLKIGKAIREQMKKDGREMLLPPKIEPDDRFYLKIHDRSRSGAKTADRMQLFRIVGLNLVTCAVTAWTDDEQQAKETQRLGEDLLLGARLTKAEAAGADSKKPGDAGKAATPTKPGKPSTFAKAKIRVTPPAQWTEEKTDAADGLVATYHDPESESNLMIITVHPLPKETKKDPKARAIVIDDIVNAEKPTLNIEGGKQVGEPDVTEGSGFLRKITTKFETKDQKFQVDSRLVLVGDAVVCVTSLATAEKAEAVRQVGDQVARDLKPIGAK